MNDGKLSYADVAKMLGVCEKTVRNYTKRKRNPLRPVVMSPRKKFFRPNTVEKWLAICAGERVELKLGPIS